LVSSYKLLIAVLSLFAVVWYKYFAGVAGMFTFAGMHSQLALAQLDSCSCLLHLTLINFSTHNIPFLSMNN